VDSWLRPFKYTAIDDEPNSYVKIGVSHEKVHDGYFKNHKDCTAHRFPETI